MGFYQSIIMISTFLLLFLAVSSSFTVDSTLRKGRRIRPKHYIKMIVVDPSGYGHFRTIQAAIDSVPLDNNSWKCIYIKEGVYREKIQIPYNKPYIYLKGEGKRKTLVVWDAYDSISTGATFTSLADNIVAKSITFVNSYNSPADGNNKNPIRAAVAALIAGDKSAFYRCGFIGLQDTLWDAQGRHYFRRCTIQGAIDFIFGAGQTFYQDCTISVAAKALNGGIGFITAQARSEASETSGFVFKGCRIGGTGKTYLGRPWREYARVLFYNSSMSRVVVPQGWEVWLQFGREKQVTFAEHGCQGAGSNTSGRVRWMKTLDKRTLRQLTNTSFIDEEGWIRRLPIKSRLF